MSLAMDEDVLWDMDCDGWPGFDLYSSTDASDDPDNAQKHVAPILAFPGQASPGHNSSYSSR